MPRSRRAPLATIVLSVLTLCAMPASALAFEPLSSFGSIGDGAGQFRQAEGLAIAADGTTYVGDFAGNRINVFDPQGAFLFAFGKKVDPHGGDVCTVASGCRTGAGSGSAGELNTPQGVAIGPEGNIFAVDEGNHRIDVFTTAGEFVRAFGKEVNPDEHAANRDICTTASGCQAAQTSRQAGALEEPIGLDFDSSGNLFVADFSVNRIDVFSAEGGFLRAFGKEVNPDEHAANRDICTAASGCQAGRELDTAGAMARPFDVKAAHNGQVVVSDFQNHRIDVFTADGGFLRAFGRAVNPDEHAANRELCTAASGCQAGTASAVAGALADPDALAINGGDEIYVGDGEMSRIDQFSIEGGFIRAFGTGVADGSAAFQVCTIACQAGSATDAPGSISSPQAIAFDCRGALYATSRGENFAHVERFGEAGTPPAPCPAPPASRPSNKFKFGKLKLNRKRGTATLLVEVPDAGTLVLKGTGLHKATGSTKGAGKISLPVKPVGKARRKLDKAGVVRLKAMLTFTPTGGTAATQLKKLTLRKTAHHKAPRKR